MAQNRRESRLLLNKFADSAMLRTKSPATIKKFLVLIILQFYFSGNESQDFLLVVKAIRLLKVQRESTSSFLTKVVFTKNYSSSETPSIRNE